MRTHHFVSLALLFLFASALWGVPESLADDEDDEWYGTGYRDPEWILERGGTIIKYRIKGEENSKRYKARLYHGNEVVEIEYGGRGYFDDAINNRYKIIVFEGTDKKMDADVVARPGQEVTLKFDLKKKKVEIETEQVIPLSKIKLTSRSARYITPADLGRVPAVSSPTSRVRDDEPESAEEEPSEEADIGAEETEEAQEDERESDPASQVIASFEATLAALESEIPALLARLEPRRSLRYVVFGRNKEVYEEIRIALEEGEEALDELASLAETSEGGMREMLLEKIENAENFLAEQTERLEARRASAGFMGRLQTVW